MAQPRKTAARKSAPSKPAAKRKPAARKPAAKQQPAPARNASAPAELVILTAERIQELFDDAVKRGRMTSSDATELVSELVRRGRKSSGDLLADVEQLLGRSRESLEEVGRKARTTQVPDRVKREVDRARRTVGIGSQFPVSGYDDLTAAQVTERLTGLTPAELRKVRDYERRNANRKSVLGAIEQKLK